ncbi:hypothetical protein APHAL10511_000438 [Amanita phalloides]|nr:hypothetical protein APHAL10511_000438 [Amanita phalloides]
MSANPLWTSSTSSSIAHSNAIPQQLRHLGLHIRTNRVGLYPPPPGLITGPPSLTSLSHFTCLLSGPLDDFLLYSGQEQSQWLIDIAHDICDPAMRRGSLQVWDAAERMWSNVNHADPLIASVYLYSVETVMALSKISSRARRSITRASGHPSTMAHRVKQRDEQRCWVTRLRGPLVNSHVCPKRMGDHLFRVVYSNFVSSTPPPPPTLSIYDEICGITLTRNLDASFGTYELGLRFVAPDEYECHSFLPPDWPQGWQLTIAGVVSDLPASAPPLHGHRISPPQPQHPRNPPPGLLRWHYLQCVIRKFAHSDYRNLQNINYDELTLGMEGDSDDEGTNSEQEWPSAALDRGRAMQVEIEHEQERQKSVAEWITSGVTISHSSVAPKCCR